MSKVRDRQRDRQRDRNRDREITDKERDRDIQMVMLSKFPVRLKYNDKILENLKLVCLKLIGKYHDIDQYNAKQGEKEAERAMLSKFCIRLILPYDTILKELN